MPAINGNVEALSIKEMEKETSSVIHIEPA